MVARKAVLMVAHSDVIVAGELAATKAAVMDNQMVGM